MKEVGLYGALLAAALVGSYLTWTAKPDAAPSDGGGVAVYRASAGDVKQLRWSSDKLDVKVERRSDDAGKYTWVTIDETKEKRPPPKPHAHGIDDAHGDDEHGDDATDGEQGPEPEPAVEIEKIHTEFLGAESADGLLTAFEPLMALRELSTDGVDTSTFGFDDKSAKILVTRGTGEIGIEIGGETYGSKDRYARHDGKILLLKDTTVRPLQFALTRLQENRLHPLAEPDIDRVELTRRGKTIALAQQNKADRAAAYWARDTTPDERDETAATWIGKLMRAKVQSYPDTSALGALEPEFTVVLTSGRASWRVEVVRVPGDDAYYARSTFNRALVQLTASLIAEAIADVDELFQD